MLDDLKTQVQLYSQRWQRSQELLEDLQVFTRTDFIPGKMRVRLSPLLDALSVLIDSCTIVVVAIGYLPFVELFGAIIL